MISISPSARTLRSPYYQSTIDDGVASFTLYNSMFLPTSFGNPEAEYWRLINGVSLWDVAVQRQVQLKGRDAAKLAQILCPRNISNMRIGQGKYIPLCNHSGVLINDPVLLKIDEDCFWFSIADSDVWLWARTINNERQLDVEISEPSAAPLAIQGPKAEMLVADICGEWVKDLKFFWFKHFEIDGIPILVARSGYSKQGGFEFYLLDKTKGTKLWNYIKEAGKKYDISAGCPNLSERVESGLLSFGGDTDHLTNPFEIRLGDYVDLSLEGDIIGLSALKKIHQEGPKRHQLGAVFEDETSNSSPIFEWMPITHKEKQVGSLTNRTWSYKLERVIGFALVSREVVAGDHIMIETEAGLKEAKLVDLPFV
ncbi:MAG: glycine cleavage system protein T [Alphaproteobacteria bacterium]|jgi:aminomethyltransferase|nr:glycine cleavage system protein T [Alphaproteobacteria bacterium]MDC3311156.1 glycine cleavage system protein T [Alphaproteobacteria bacterium]